MNFHLASRGLPLTEASQQGGRTCLNCSNKIIIFFLAPFARYIFINQIKQKK